MRKAIAKLEKILEKLLQSLKKIIVKKKAAVADSRKSSKLVACKSPGSNIRKSGS
jgi:hypothetical protein